MIQLLATKYRKSIAFTLFLLFDLSFFLSAEAEKMGGRPLVLSVSATGLNATRPGAATPYEKMHFLPAKGERPRLPAIELNMRPAAKTTAAKHPAIGGPNQPEMTSFKPVDMKDLVNLFTGDFSYNIPLMDVGGYPVNLYYNGEIGPEQEASWVGLGWNINPGNINRNMRGVPDDFNGDEQLVQQQNMKPNVTWGASVGANAEYIGLKFLAPDITFTTGVSWNNYLGIALDLGVEGGLEFKVAGKAGSEKSPSVNFGLNLGLDLNSRSGLTMTPSASLTGSAFLNDRSFNLGANLSTSYNSRVGIRSLQITDQLSVSKISEKTIHHEGFDIIRHVRSKMSANLYSTSISFARPSYMPSIRVPMVNSSYSGHFQIGTAIFGAYASAEAEIYKQTSTVDYAKAIKGRPMVGYLYAENAMGNPNAVMDFTRLNDREVTPNTPIISAPQYTYDVFTIQGEGTGGSIRAYRNDPGYVRDNATGSKDNNDALGVDIGIPGHYGANFNAISTPSAIGEWLTGNNMRTTIPFRPRAANTSWENIYFRNPGETSVLDNGEYDGIGGLNLVRYVLSGDPHSATILPKLDNFSKTGSFIGTTDVVVRPATAPRKKRTQLIDFLTAADASNFGLDQQIRNYDNQTLLDPATNTLRYTNIPRVGGYRLKNHISQINVTESNGRRYVYGIPVYNTTQKDFTFTVQGSDYNSPDNLDQISYGSNEPDPLNNPAITGSVNRDGYAQVTTTPAYAHSFLLSGLLSPDYVDVTGDGITDDDLGDAVKFNYTEILDGSGNPAVHKWRTPIPNLTANFNAGSRSNLKDDKGLISYGERESWYTHSIESKTMIAIFTLQDRADGKSVAGQDGGLDGNNHSLKCLSKIELFSKADLKKNGYGTASTNAKAIKTVNFTYDYSLCQNTPDNPGSGKLTLTGITFSYNNQISRTSKDKYVFSYGTDAASNPGYAVNSSDRWGTYKPASMNPAGMRNADYSYTPQQQPGGSGSLVSAKPMLDQNAGAWSLKKVLLPSGGQIEVTYESDDYAFVQNQRAADMMSIAGFGSSPTSFSNELYGVIAGNYVENNYLFINVPVPCTATDVYAKYLSGASQIAVRMMVNMPNGKELITSYASFDPGVGNYGVYSSNIIWIKLKPTNSRGVLSMSALEYLREQLPAQAFPGYDVSGDGIQAVGDALIGMLDALSTAFSDPVNALRSRGLARSVLLDHSFARLNDPDGYKYGGGQRVKSLKLKDNWQPMSGTYNTVYDQEYNYETTETFNGAIRTISSGVASYEPAMGGEENPFQSAFLVADKLPLGPTSYGAVETPILESFFPSPVVGYSRVTVTSLPTNAPTAQQKTRSGIGRQVTEFYTAKDFPVFYSNTSLDGTTDLQAHDASTTNFFSKYAFDSRTISQGFLVANNDMHGKLHTQTSYAENDPTLKVSYTENFYRNTGVNGLNESFDFVSSNGGAINPGNLGIDVELMTDTREFKVSSSSMEIQAQVDLFPVFFPFWLPFIWPVKGSSQNIYRAITTTKVITYHSVLDSSVTMDKGSRIGSKNLLYDAETGQTIVTRMNNEFDKPLYNTTWPAWWAYSGMGPAYRNTEILWSGINISDGRLVSGGLDPALLESGDELFSGGPPPAGGSCPAPSGATGRIWVLDKNKNNPPFPATSHDIIFIDSVGRPYTNTNITSLRVIRSGKRNMLDVSAATTTSMISPIVPNGSTRKLSLTATSNVLNAAAMEYNEKWQIDKGVIGTFTTVDNQANCTSTEVPDCNGHFDKNINPYRKGLLGNFRAYRAMTFYDNRAYGNATIPDPAVPTNIAKDGALANFTLYWDFNTSNALAPNTSLTNWIETNRVTRVNSRGLQMETKNADGIYTSAIYGYSKTLPVAVTSNSPFYQSFYDGFEDRGYTQGIENDQAPPCPSGQPDFAIMPNTSLVNTDATGFNAHTGKFVLGVNQNSTASISIPIVSSDNTTINPMSFGSTTTKSLVNAGINSSYDPPFPDINNWSVSPPGIVTLANSSVTVNAHVSTYRSNQFDFAWDGWIQIPAPNTYHFNLNCSASYTASALNFWFTFMLVTITNSNGVQINETNQSGTNSSMSTGEPVGTLQSNSSTYTAFLCPGIYHIVGSGRGTSLANDPNSSIVGDSWDQFNFSCTDCNVPFYKGSQDVCTTATAIPGDASMLNPTFSMPAGQPMVLSAWVKEGQTPTPGIESYASNSITFNDGAGHTTTMLPQGPIIEGWQRYEGNCTAAAGGTTASFNFINSGGQTLYLDDIRIHPFNAEMKSYVYDPVSLRLISEIDANNYATFYEYDEEGILIRTKAETQKGIRTIKESRSAKQRNLTTVQ